MESILSFYTWWDPEKDLGTGMARSLARIVDLGFNSISYDMQYNWYHRSRDVLDTVIGACQERDLSVVPVVSYGYLPWASALSELTGMEVTTSIDMENRKTDCIDTHDPQNVEPFLAYLTDLIDHYSDALFRIDGRVLLNFWEPSMATWSKTRRTHLGYGQAMIEDFRDWSLERFTLEELNLRWGTSFSASGDIDPPRVGLWDENRDIIFIRPDPRWDDWCLFRAGVLSEFYRRLFEELKAERDVEVAVGLSQHGVVTQHDAYHQRCVYLPFWRDVPADRFIVSDDMYCKSAQEVKLCMEAELALFERFFPGKVTAFVTPVEGKVLVERPETLYSLCEEHSPRYVYLYAWNEMADGANIRDHPEIWEEIRSLI